ncbi:MAG: TOBE domain-containing protein, partial [Actinomycetota bacterium]
MHRGRFEQVGAPQDVYELPATEFVASFLGASNLLDGEIESVDGGVAKVALAAGGAVSVPASRLPEGGGPVRLGVRPEKLHIRPSSGDANGHHNSIDAVVSISTYTGVSTSYECTTPDAATVVVYVQNLAASQPAIGAGSPVRLTWDPEHTFAVKRSTEAEGTST